MEKTTELLTRIDFWQDVAKFVKEQSKAKTNFPGPVPIVYRGKKATLEMVSPAILHFKLLPGEEGVTSKVSLESHGQNLALTVSHVPSTLETIQGQIDDFFSPLPYKCYQNRVASVGDNLRFASGLSPGWL